MLPSGKLLPPSPGAKRLARLRRGHGPFSRLRRTRLKPPRLLGVPPAPETSSTGRVQNCVRAQPAVRFGYALLWHGEKFVGTVRGSSQGQKKDAPGSLVRELFRTVLPNQAVNFHHSVWQAEGSGASPPPSVSQQILRPETVKRRLLCSASEAALPGSTCPYGTRPCPSGRFA